jgi:hypothetical protein
MGYCLVSEDRNEWQEVMDWAIKKLKGKGLRSTICKIALWATVYYLWL